MTNWYGRRGYQHSGGKYAKIGQNMPHFYSSANTRSITLIAIMNVSPTKRKKKRLTAGCLQNYHITTCFSQLLLKNASWQNMPGYAIFSIKAPPNIRAPFLPCILISLKISHLVPIWDMNAIPGNPASCILAWAIGVSRLILFFLFQ